MWRGIHVNQRFAAHVFASVCVQVWEVKDAGKGKVKSALEGRKAVIRFKCDLCGKMVTKEERYIVNIRKTGDAPWPTYDLCRECARKMKDYLQARKVER